MRPPFCRSRTDNFSARSRGFGLEKGAMHAIDLTRKDERAERTGLRNLKESKNLHT